MTDHDPIASSSTARVTTRRGDDGYTDLLGPGRVPKYAPRPTAVGTFDEANSALGLARALCPEEDTRLTIYDLQQGLYKLMAELSVPVSVYDKAPFKLDRSDVDQLERVAAELKAKVKIGREFVVPGGSPCGAALDLARTTVRRGERVTARLLHDGEISNAHVLQWINRLSDVIFIMARYVERDSIGS